MSTLVENVAKVKSAHDALSASIEAKGVSVPAGTKLTGMPALVDQIETGGGGGGEPTNDRACFTYDSATSLVVPKIMTVDMTQITNLQYFFYYCQFKSVSLPPGFGQAATDLLYCFRNCSNLSSLTLPEGFGQAAIRVGSCFDFCSNLSSLTLPEGFGQAATNIDRCFAICSNLSSLTLPAGFGQSATDIGRCFYGCGNLSSLELPAGFGQSAIYSTSVFDSCGALTIITGNPNFKVSIDLSYSPKLTHDSLMVIINGLQTVTSAKTLKLGETNLAKLTDEEKQIATNKGWTLA